MEARGLKHIGTHKYSGADLPASIDWVAEGKVTPVKNQAHCGSCWAFSTTGAVEGAWAIKTGTLVSLSEQQLVDCASSSPWKNHGCHGGMMDFGFSYIEQQGICTEDSYPYTGQDGSCAAAANGNCKVGVPAGSVTGYKDVQPKDLNALMEAVAQQPVSIAIEADQDSFRNYKSGVLTSQCGDRLDHGVLLVGYGTDNGIDYWKVKNSWGPEWGDQGYLRIERKVSDEGLCGIKLNPSYPVVSSSIQAESNPDGAFENFVKRFGKSYVDEAERAIRFAIFKVNLAKVEAENAKSHSYKLGINEFSDLTDEEFLSNHLGMLDTMEARGLKHIGTHKYSGADLPASIDWVAEGKVTPVKNQAHCGSCWAFSTTGAVEGAWAIKTGTLVSLSEQQLVDCASSSPYMNHGCHGGKMDFGFSYIEQQGLCTEDSYPYKAVDGSCAATANGNCTVGVPAGKVTGYKDVESKDLNALMEAVAQQPVSVAIEADQTSFRNYKSGVLTSQCGDHLDHGVLLVGYGTDNGVDYWKVKNSWGPQWGDQGFVRIERKVSDEGLCGIKMHPSYPVIGSQSEMDIVV